MGNYDARAAWRKYEEEKNKKHENQSAMTPSDSESSNKEYDARAAWRKFELEKAISFDTFETDLNTMATTLDGIYNGWQDVETMKNTRAEVERNYNRLLYYGDYRTNYDTDLPDLTELTNAYKGALDEWGGLSELYAEYKSADDYNNAVKLAEEKAKAAEERRRYLKNLNIYNAKKEIELLESQLEEAKKLYSIGAQKQNTMMAEGIYRADIAYADYNIYLNRLGYSGQKDLEDTLAQKKKDVSEAKRLNKFIRLSEAPEHKEESESYATKGMETSNAAIDDIVGMYKMALDLGITPYNDVEGAKLAMYERNSGEDKIFKGYDDLNRYRELTDEEFKDFAYWLGKDAENGSNDAAEYLDIMGEILDSRIASKKFEQYKGKTFKELLYGVYAGLDQFQTGMANLFNFTDDYIPVNATQQLSGLIRNDLKDNGPKILGTSVGQGAYDLITTTSNMLPSILVSTAVGTVSKTAGAAVGASLMGASASGNAYQEMLNLGYDKGQARTYSVLVGVSEAGLQYAMGGVGKLGGISGKVAKAVSGIDNGLARFAIRYGASALSEGFEESVQEILNPLFKSIATGEAPEDINWSEVAYSGLLGALSGGFFEGGPIAVNTYREASFNKNMGQSIRANEKIGDVLNLASLSPEGSSAYQTSKRYSNKGINAENITDSQLGRLYTETRANAQAVLDSKTSTAKQRAQAEKVIADIDAYTQKNQTTAIGNHIAKDILKGKPDDVKKEIGALIEDGFQSGKDTQTWKLATELSEKLNKGEKITEAELSNYIEVMASEINSEGATEVTERLTELGEKGDVSKIAEVITKQSSGQKLTSAETELLENSESGSRVIAEMEQDFNSELIEAAEGMDNATATLFLKNYDGEADVEKYAADFNLALEYSRMNYNQDTILANRGVLSPRAVQNIYNTAVVAPRMERQRAIDDIIVKYSGKTTNKARIDDSVIDYENKGTKGKVNWKDLNKRQREAITFVKGFAKVSGLNLKLVKNGEEEGFNGKYVIRDNTIILDVYAGIDKLKGLFHDSIVPTLSHELTHWMKNKSPVLYAELSEKVFASLTRATGKTELELIAAEQERLKNKFGKEFSEDYARDEIIARSCEDMLSMSEEGKKLFNSLSEKEQKTLVDKIKDIIKNIKSWVNDLLGQYESNSLEATILKNYKEDLQEISKLWDKMLANSIEANKALEESGAFKEQKNTAEGGVQYSFRNSQSGAANDLLLPYNEELTGYISQRGDYIVDSFERLVDVVNFAFDKPNEKATAYFGIIPTDILSKIEKSIPNLPKEMTGNLFKAGKDYSVAATLDSIRHLADEKKLSREEIIEYLDRMTDCIVEFDTVTFDYYYEKGNKMNGILFKKTFDDGTFASFEIVSNKKRSLNLQTFYMQKVDYKKKKSAETTLLNKDSTANVQDEDRSNFNSSILNSAKKSNEQNVNIEDEQLAERDYSYESLIAKPDMKLTEVVTDIPSNRADVIKLAKKNISEVGMKDSKSGNLSVYVNDIDSNVIIGSDGLKHGLRRAISGKIDANYIVTIKAGEIIKNSIRVNEMTPSKEGAKKSYILIGAAKAKTGELYIVRSVINHFTNELTSIDVVYAINAKKESAALSAPGFAAKPLSVTDSTISISELLEYVNRYFPDILPESVLRHYGYSERPVGSLGESVLFSERDAESIYDIVGDDKRIDADMQRLEKDLLAFKGIVGNNKMSAKSFGSLADYLNKTSSGNMNREKLCGLLKDVYDYIQGTDDLQISDVFTKVYDIAYDLMNHNLDVPINYFKNVMAQVRKESVALTSAQKEVANDISGNYREYHKRVFGRINISKDGVPLPEMWKKWAEKYPAIFDANIGEAQQVQKLLEIADTLKDASSLMENYEREEAIRHLVTEIYNKLWDIVPGKTEDTKKIKAKHRSLMENIRKEYEVRQKEVILHPVGETALKYDRLYKKLSDKKSAEIKRAKQLGKDKMARYKDNAERRTRIQRITTNALTLNDWLVKNSKEKHIHESLKEPVIALLKAIDFSSKRMLDKNVSTQKDMSLSKALSKVKDMLLDASAGHEELIALYGHDLDEDIKKLVEAADDIMRTVGDNEYVLNQMSLEDIKVLDKTVRTLKHTVTSMNQYHMAQYNAGVKAHGRKSVEELDELGEIKTAKIEKIKSGVLWNNTNPYHAFRRYGEAAMVIFRALQDGQDKLAFLAKEILDTTKKLYTSKELKKWVKTFYHFEVKQPDGKIQAFDMNVPQIMSLYCLSKQEDSRRHLLSKGGGITLSETGKTTGKKKNIQITEEDLDRIIGNLDKRTLAVADGLQKFMNERGAELGNEISMIRFGTRMFTTKNYFPIKVSESEVGGRVDEVTDSIGVKSNDMLALLNMSFTKKRSDKAAQSIEIGDIFDIFSSHMSDMARYNALALPILDAYKWFNYRTVDEDGNRQSIEASMRTALGDESIRYFKTLLKDLNGTSKSEARETLGVKFFRNAKIAAVANNLRVVLLQPVSYIRAGAVMDNKYLLRALAHKPKIEYAKKHCGIALWKALGYFDMNITKGLTEKIKHAEGLRDRFIEFSLKGVEFADEISWGYLWNACELEVRETRKDLKVGSEEYFKEVGLRLRDVIYATQVVDSTLTRSQTMRSHDRLDKMLTSFMSEPTLSLNMVTDAFITYNLDKKRMGKEKAIKKNGKYIRKTVTAYIVTNVVSALIASAFDALRDIEDEDKDEKYYIKLILNNLYDDMSILNKLPYINIFFSAINGFSASRTDAQWIEEAVNSIKRWGRFFTGDGSAEKAFKESLKTFSDISGMGIYNIYRDMMVLLERFEIFTAEDLEEMFKDLLG